MASNKNLDHLTDAQKGWLAGLLDGEGCLTINRQAPGKHGRVNPSHRLYVKVTMGHRETVERCMALTGMGSISQHAVGNGRWNDAWSWLVSTQEAGALLRGLRPLLVTKAAEADVALEFVSLPRFRLGGAGGNPALTAQVVEAREDCFRRLRDLKPSARFRTRGAIGA